MDHGEDQTERTGEPASEPTIDARGERDAGLASDWAVEPWFGDAQDVRRLVKRNFFGAGLAALLLLYFGFVEYQLGERDEFKAFELGEMLFIYGLRTGGSLMAAVALVSMSGRPAALLADALVSIAVGICLIAAAVLMSFEGGMDWIIVIVGALIIAAGIRSGRLWAQIFRWQSRPHAGESPVEPENA